MRSPAKVRCCFAFRPGFRTLEHDWQSPLPRHWLAELGRCHTLIRSDDRGCGLSDWNAADLSFETRLDDLETIVDAARLDRFVMAGNSQAAPQSAERTRLLLELIDMGWGTDDAEFRQVFAAMFAPGGCAERWRWLTEKMRMGTSPGNAARLLLETSRVDVCDLAREVRGATFH
jgi:pimeloyl-ACP methyl ester carboxylesterase